MTLDMGLVKQRLRKMTIINVILLSIGVALAVAHFLYGVGWALWGFVGFIAAGFAVQIWFIRGIVRMSKGS